MAGQVGGGLFGDPPRAAVGTALIERVTPTGPGESLGLGERVSRRYIN